MAAVQPSDRPAGSEHIIIWATVERDAANAATYPKLNGNYPSDAGAAVLVPVRCLLASTAALTDNEKQLPKHVFDDENPAGASPHAGVLAGATQGILTATDLNITARTWCQNLDITVTPRTEVASDLIATWDPQATRVCLDSGASSGLGTNTGRPVVVVGIIFETGAQVPATLDLEIRIRVPHTTVR